jgi:hypothetical protein
VPDDERPPETFTARLDADAGHQDRLHREVRCRVTAGDDPADIETGCDRITRAYVAQNVSWTEAEADEYIRWHAAATARWLGIALTEEN